MVRQYIRRRSHGGAVCTVLCEVTLALYENCTQRERVLKAEKVEMGIKGKTGNEGAGIFQTYPLGHGTRLAVRSWRFEVAIYKVRPLVVPMHLYCDLAIDLSSRPCPLLISSSREARGSGCCRQASSFPSRN